MTIEEFRRSNQVPQRNKRAKAGYGLVREMESFTSKRNGALDKECENAESLTMLSRELVLKEAMRLELEREAVEAERKRAKQSIFGPDHGKISSQREEWDLRNHNKLMAFNLDTTKENW